MSRSSRSTQVRAVASKRRTSPSRGLLGWRRHAGRDSSQRHLGVWALDPQSMDCFPWFRSEVGSAPFQAAPENLKSKRNQPVRQVSNKPLTSLLNGCYCCAGLLNTWAKLAREAWTRCSKTPVF